MFANTHWWVIFSCAHCLCSGLDVFVCLSVLDAVAQIHLFCWIFFFFAPRSVCGDLYTSTSVHCSPRTYPCCLQVKYTSCGRQTVPRRCPLFCLFAFHVASHYTDCCDTMHHGPPLFMDHCVPPWLRPVGTQWHLLIFKWGCIDLMSAIPKQKSKYLTFDKCRYQRILSSLSVCSPLLPCSMCIKRQTQHWL